MTPGHVYFVGAGPGAPDLITLRGRALLGQAGVVIYADSLVDPSICQYAPPEAEVYGSAAMTLEETVDIMVRAAREGRTVVRLQSGDPAVYGAIHEQIGRLNEAGIPWSIVPGVSSAFAAAAALGVELTVPGVTQTVILSRVSGRASPVPPAEDLRLLAEHRASLVLFLSITQLHRIVTTLKSAGYPPETPVAVAYRVSWPDEAVIRGTLADIAEQVRKAKIARQALILIGPAVVGATGGERSRLYSPGYTHLFRSATGEGAPKRQRRTVKAEAP